MQGSRIRSVAGVIVVAAAVMPAPLLGLQARDGEDSEAIVARFVLPENLFENVTSSAQLVQALRDHLALELAMPLEGVLQADFRGWAGEVDGAQPGYLVQSSLLGVRYGGRQTSATFPFAQAVRASHGEGAPDAQASWDDYDIPGWDEEDAWSQLVNALDIGLPQSSDAFHEPPAPGRLGLRVAHAEVREFDLPVADPGWDGYYFRCCRGEAGRTVMELRLDVSFRSAMDDTPLPDVRKRTNVVVLEVVPGTATDAVATTEDAPPPAAAELSPDDAEALSMSEDFAFACDPAALTTAGTHSASMVTFDDEQRIGQAAYRIENDGELVIVLGKVDADPFYCLVLFSPEGMPGVGTYDVLRLSRTLQESGPPEGVAHPFVAALIGPERTFVSEGGSVEITTVEGRFQGRFDLDGWTVSRGVRKDGVKVIGAFNAWNVGN